MILMNDLQETIIKSKILNINLIYFFIILNKHYKTLHAIQKNKLVKVVESYYCKDRK